MEELKILQKTYDMMSYLYQTLQQYPKSEKFTLAAETKRAAYELLRLLITANKRYHKKTTMQDADIQLDVESDLGGHRQLLIKRVATKPQQ